MNVGKLMLGDPDRFSALHAGGHPRIAGAFAGENRRRGSRGAGRGNIVGKPMAAMLCQKEKNANATVTICHSRTRDIKAHCRRADILIAAMGVAEFVKADMVKPGAVVIDVGVNRVAIRRPKAARGWWAMWISQRCSRLPERSRRIPAASGR